MNSFYKTSETLKQGSMTLKGEYYTDPEILKLEYKKIFHQRWICIGHISEFKIKGNYKVVNLDKESFILYRDDLENIQSFYNVCRHRGTRICNNKSGNFSKSIQCGYHGWTYNLQGDLTGAPNMEDVEEFKKSNFSLHKVPVAKWEGFLFINISESPSNFNLEFSTIKSRFSEWDIPNLVQIDFKSYNVNCNWKLIVQNYSECYHCPIIHPKLADITPYTGGRNDLTDGPYLGGYMEMKEKTISESGHLCGPPIGNLSQKNQNRVYYYAIFPNMLLSLHPDYVMVHTVWPEDMNKCRIDCSWYFAQEVKNSIKYHAENAIDFWDKTNKEDWNICEKSQLGIQSKKYRPGPYSGQESLLAAYDEYYLSVLNET